MKSMKSMKSMTNVLKDKVLSFFKKEEGATMVEYAIMLALIAIVSIIVIGNLGTAVSSTFSRAHASLTATG